MRGFFFMRGRLLFLSLVLALFALFNVQAFAQIGLVVQLPPTANAANALKLASDLNGAVIDVIPEFNQFLLSVPVVPRSSDNALNNVRWVEPLEAITLPPAPRIGYLSLPQGTASDWYKYQPAFAHIHLAGALTHSTGLGVVVADFNSRVDPLHPAFSGYVTVYDSISGVNPHHGVTAQNDSSASYLDASSASYLDASSASYLNDSSASYLDDSSASYLDGGKPAYAHGMLVAGIIHAIAPNAPIWSFTVFDDNGSSNTWEIAKWARWAVNHGAQVLNMSFGTPDKSAMLQSAVDWALQHGVTVAVSAGNSNTSAGTQNPAAFAGVLTTAATDNNDVKASFSNFGQAVRLAAPGVSIISTVPGGYGICNGTSCAAPITAGAAALVKGLTQTEVDSRILAGAINIDAKNPLHVGQLGDGLIDLLNAVQPK